MANDKAATVDVEAQTLKVALPRQFSTDPPPAPEDMGSPDEYVVQGRYITVKTNTRDGKRIVGLHYGAPLPADVSTEHLAHLVRKGLVAKRDEAPAQPPAPLDQQGATGDGGLPEPQPPEPDEGQGDGKPLTAAQKRAAATGK